MRIREDRTVAIKKVAPLTERISRQYGVDLDLESDVDHLTQIFEHYSTKKQFLVALQGEVDAMQNSDYAKATFIAEAMKMFLREIAPKRTRKKKH